MATCSATLKPMDDDVIDVPQGVVPLPMPRNIQGQPGSATLEQAKGSRSVHGRSVRCTATSKGTGEQCRNSAVLGSNVCVSHGAAQGTPARAAADTRVVEQYTTWLEGMVPKAMERMEAIIDNPEDDKIALAAVKDVLDRAGFGAVNKNLNVNADVSGDDIDEQIEQMLVRRAAGEG